MISFYPFTHLWAVRENLRHARRGLKRNDEARYKIFLMEKDEASQQQVVPRQ
jgi:hypothetical protein